MKSLLTLLFLMILSLSGIQQFSKSEIGSEEVSFNQQVMADTLKIFIEVGEDQFEMKLSPNPTSLSLLEQVPFTVEFDDFAGLEKIFYPPKKLSKDNAPNGAKPQKGDVMYYSPWGDVALFYKDASFASGLIPMGTIEDIDALVQALGKTKKATFIKP